MNLTTVKEEKIREHLMIKLTLRYIRYVLSALATLGFGLTEN